MKKKKTIRRGVMSRGMKTVPPKRTGKRGIGPKDEGPLDPGTDFKDEQAPAAGEQAEAGSLLAKQPPKPTVVGNRIQMQYLKPSFNKTTKGERLLSFHMTLALTKEHAADSLLPASIRAGWKIISKAGRKKLDLVDVPGQKAVFYLASDGDDAKLILSAAKVVNVSLAVVQKKGDGETQKIIRLSFRLQVVVSSEVAEFAEQNYGADFWLTLEDTEEDLFDEEEEEE
jgi:hypothetical protein